MRKNKILSAVLATVMLASSATAFAAEVGESIKVDDYAQSAAETQKLIDARPDLERPMEKLNKGAVAIKMDGYTYISWRWLGTESADTKYNVYKGNTLLTAQALNATNYTDINPTNEVYKIVPVVNGVEQTDKAETATVWDNNYFDIPIQRPEENSVNGEKYTYSPNDASVADLDGDGEYEIILKWDPSNSKDAASGGYTGECIIDAYEMDGTRMWRINMGHNIRAGAHDTQFMVYDYDSDGKAEMACRTADGTIAGDGTLIGEDKNYAALNGGKNLTGPLYLTVFNGKDGSVIDTVDYDPQTTGTTESGKKWDVTTWGDGGGNRSERYLAAVAYLDGKRPSMVFARGYYTGPEGDAGGRTVIAAFDLVDGKIQKKWRFDTMDYNNKYIGQGNHSMSAADVDFDGCDELIYGSLAVDNDGQPMYSTGLGHGDAQHVADLDTSRPGLEVYSAHEDKGSAYGYEMRDARTGEILYGERTNSDNGRGTSADVDPRYPGAEGWSAAGVLTAADGTVISKSYTMSANFLAYWDADTGREVQDGIYISKWNPDTSKAETIFTASGCTAVNGTKANPSLTADIFGDWREEVMYPLKDGSALRIYMSTTPTAYKLPTLMHDIQYRMHVAYQNDCYNQPTHTSYYLGYDTKTVPVPQIYTVGDNAKNPDLAKKSWNIADLYSGEKVELVLDTPTALINGIPKRVDNDNTDVVPCLDENDRTLVPIRFISEAFGAEVGWDGATQTITITAKDKDEIKMVIGKQDYEVYDYQGKTAGPPGSGMVDVMEVTYHTMDTAPVIMNDRTMVPLRAIGEALGKVVHYSEQYILISDIEQSMENAVARKNAITSAPVPEKIEIVPINQTGKKYYDNQLDVYGVEATDNDGNAEAGAVDLDINTRWSAYGANTLTVDLGSEQVVKGVAIAMWKGSERIYPFLIEYSTDGKTWKTALPKTQNTGFSEEFEKYMFPQAITARYIRYNGDGATDPKKNYCHISEIVIFGE